MIQIRRADSDASDFEILIAELDKDLAIKNGSANEFFAKYNKTDHIKHVILAYDSDKPVGCGAFKHYADDVVEIKRMFVPVAQRGNGIAGTVLVALQTWAKELGYTQCILETGDKMIEAIGLYTKHGFDRIPNYGQYADVLDSVCFSKQLS